MALSTPLAPPDSFETALSELDTLVQTLEAGKLPLEGSLAGYQRGVELIRYCEQKLSSAEQQIKMLESGLLQDFSTTDSDD